MSLTKKQKKFYKKLIQARLLEMGIKDSIQYTKLPGKKEVQYPEANEIGHIVMKTASLNTFRAANLYSNLTKKLLTLSPEGIARFLAANPAPTQTPEPEVQIESQV